MSTGGNALPGPAYGNTGPRTAPLPPPGRSVPPGVTGKKLPPAAAAVEVGLGEEDLPADLLPPVGGVGEYRRIPRPIQLSNCILIA